MIIVRGAGDLATGTIYELHKAGYHVLALECEKPTAIRREVSFGEAVYDGVKVVEGVTARKIDSVEEVNTVWNYGEIPVLIDAAGESIEKLHPLAVIDLILAKKNLGTRREMAPLVIGAGPGFTAGEDVDIVIETMRGYTPGKAIYEGSALADTGIPGMVGGYAKERVIHAPAEGILRQKYVIGDVVEKGTEIAFVGQTPVYATLTGILRGMIRDGMFVKKGMKIADIDPRLDQQEACYKRSDKAIAIAKGILNVLERHLRLQHLLQIEPAKNRVIAFVGGGGKTTLIYELARELAGVGKQVLVTTTTHMKEPEKKWEADHTVGVPCEEQLGKIKGVSEEEYRKLKDRCDILLVEADGAKRKPLKAPAEHEPVIPKDADMVIGMAGASAIGKTIEEGCHRAELVGKLLGKNITEVITVEDLVKVLKSEQGQKKQVSQIYRMVIGQADLLTKEQRKRLEEEPGIYLFSRKGEEDEDGKCIGLS